MEIKLLRHLEIGTFLSEHLKKSDDDAYDYMLKDFIQRVVSMSEKINLS